MVDQQIKLLRALSDKTRIRILQCLRDDALCACAIHPLVNKAQSTVSKHLKILHEAGILGSRREGINIHYFIQSQEALQILNILQIPKLSSHQIC